ncbi:hypothetical protein ABW19_dt0204023 [Dactylella cylindrospora]|nr:hypothetical protein ABW19_dt0204023 [Dactylella cylindrospora]
MQHKYLEPTALSLLLSLYLYPCTASARWFEAIQSVKLRRGIDQYDDVGKTKWSDWANLDPRSNIKQFGENGGCFNNIVTKSGAVLHTIRYFPEDVNPAWPFYIDRLEIHSVPDCADNGPLIVPMDNPETELVDYTTIREEIEGSPVPEYISALPPIEAEEFEDIEEPGAPLDGKFDPRFTGFQDIDIATPWTGNPGGFSPNINLANWNFDAGQTLSPGEILAQNAVVQAQQPRGRDPYAISDSNNQFPGATWTNIDLGQGDVQEIAEPGEKDNMEFEDVPTEGVRRNTFRKLFGRSTPEPSEEEGKKQDSNRDYSRGQAGNVAGVTYENPMMVGSDTESPAILRDLSMVTGNPAGFPVNQEPHAAEQSYFTQPPQQQNMQVESPFSDTWGESTPIVIQNIDRIQEIRNGPRKNPWEAVLNNLGQEYDPSKWRLPEKVGRYAPEYFGAKSKQLAGLYIFKQQTSFKFVINKMLVHDTDALDTPAPYQLPE